MRSMNEIIRHAIPIESDPTFETGFIDLLNVHNIYIHCGNIGNYNCIGVRGDNPIKKGTCKLVIRLFDFRLSCGTS